MKLCSAMSWIAVLVTLGAPAQAVPVDYVARLSGAAEVPPNASLGTGSAVVTHDATAHTLDVFIEFSGLVGNTTAAHIHCCADTTANAPVASSVPTFPGFPSGVTAGTYNHTFDLTLSSSYNPNFITANGGTVAGAEAALGAGFAASTTYVNIHTSTFGGGEIRGQLRPIDVFRSGFEE